MNLTNIYNNIRGQFIRQKSSLPFDQPTVAPWFLPVFYFSSADALNGGSAHGLLCDDYSFTPIDNKLDINDSFAIGDSAYNFFLQNGDEYRADQVKLLNEILFTMSNKAPWHFTKIDCALGSTLDKALNESKFATEDSKQLTLTMSSDTEDRMHHTFFSIYKNLIWDSERDVMLLPKNLRQFNMGLILFTPPTTFVDGLTLDDIHEKILYRLRQGDNNSIPDFKVNVTEVGNETSSINTSKTVMGKAHKKQVSEVRYKWDFKNFPYYEKMTKDRNIDIKMDLSDTSSQSSWWQFIEFRGCEFDAKSMFGYQDLGLDNTQTTYNDSSKDKLVINFKKAYTTTCEKFFDIGLTDAPSQYDEYHQKSSFNNVNSHGSQRWNTRYI